MSNPLPLKNCNVIRKPEVDVFQVRTPTAPAPTTSVIAKSVASRNLFNLPSSSSTNPFELGHQQIRPNERQSSSAIPLCHVPTDLTFNRRHGSVIDAPPVNPVEKLNKVNIAKAGSFLFDPKIVDVTKRSVPLTRRCGSIVSSETLETLASSEVGQISKKRRQKVVWEAGEDDVFNQSNVSFDYPNLNPKNYQSGFDDENRNSEQLNSMRNLGHRGHHGYHDHENKRNEDHENDDKNGNNENCDDLSDESQSYLLDDPTGHRQQRPSVHLLGRFGRALLGTSTCHFLLGGTALDSRRGSRFYSNQLRPDHLTAPSHSAENRRYFSRFKSLNIPRRCKKWFLHRRSGKCELERLSGFYQPEAFESSLIQSKCLHPTGWALINYPISIEDSRGDKSSRDSDRGEQIRDSRTSETHNWFSSESLEDGSRITIGKESNSNINICNYCRHEKKYRPTLENVANLIAHHKTVLDAAEFRLGLERNVRAIQNATRAMSYIALLASIPYDTENCNHEESLIRLWNSLSPDLPLRNRVGSHWQQLGFQGCDPATDFRGTGVLGLHNLLFFATSFNSLARRLLIESQRCSDCFAIMGINVTAWLLNWLLIRKNVKRPSESIENRCTCSEPSERGAQQQTSESTAGVCGTGAVRQNKILPKKNRKQIFWWIQNSNSIIPPANLLSFFYMTRDSTDALAIFNYVYIYTFYKFHLFWVASKSQSILEFPIVANEFRRQFHFPDDFESVKRSIT